MNKRKSGRKFSLKADPRKALMRSLIRALFDKEKIRTTLAKAKEISPIADKLITKAKKGDLPARRQLIAYIGPALSEKLIKDIAPLFKERSGGYVRVLKLGPRKSDGALMSVIELVKTK